MADRVNAFIKDDCRITVKDTASTPDNSSDGADNIITYQLSPTLTYLQMPVWLILLTVSQLTFCRLYLQNISYLCQSVSVACLIL